MKYLLFLNKFECDKNKLIRKLSDIKTKILFDEGKYLVVESSNIEKCLSLNEVSKIAKIMTEWKRFRAFDFSALKKDSLLAMQDSGKKSYKIKTKFHDKTKFSSRTVYKHVNALLKQEGYSFDENADVVLYIEFKKNEKDFYRISYMLPGWTNALPSLNIDYSKFTIILENPSTVMEVSDFLRICWIFKMPLCIITKNKEFERILSKAKQITKGIVYEKMNLSVSEKFPENYFLVGFSKLAKKNEIDLKKLFSEKKNTALVFGDEKFGLTQEARDKMDVMIRLTPELKKPLKSSQSLSYVLGIYTSMNV